MQKIGDFINVPNSIVSKFKTDNTDKYVSREFQKYAYELAKELDDLDHTSLYMRIVKINPRGLVESARSFVKDASNARSKPRLFMWRLKQLKISKTVTKEN
jgi:hypothetical protein